MGGRERGLQNSNTENIARMAGSKRQSGHLHPNVVWHSAGLGRDWATLLLLCLCPLDQIWVWGLTLSWLQACPVIDVSSIWVRSLTSWLQACHRHVCCDAYKSCASRVPRVFTFPEWDQVTCGGVPAEGNWNRAKPGLHCPSTAKCACCAPCSARARPQIQSCQPLCLCFGHSLLHPRTLHYAAVLMIISLHSLPPPPPTQQFC